MNSERNIEQFTSIGVGKFISRLEIFILKIVLKSYENFKSFFKKKYSNLIKFLIINIANTQKLTFYSKICILISITIFLIKFSKNAIITKKINIDKCSFSKYLFFNDKVVRNKSVMLDKESSLKINKVVNDERWMKILKLMEYCNINNRNNVKNRFLGKSDNFDKCDKTDKIDKTDKSIIENEKSNSHSYMSLSKDKNKDKENPSDPFFKIMQYYLNFNKSVK